MTEPIDSRQPSTDLVLGEDYYLEGEYMIFTADFLRRRGYCCESGCRHCPYGFGPDGLRKKLESQNVKEGR